MIRYLKQNKFLLFLAVLFTAISSLSYVFIAILLQQVMDIVDANQELNKSLARAAAMRPKI